MPSKSPLHWPEPRFQLALKMVRQASRLSRHLQSSLKAEAVQKSDASPVTVVDLAVQALVALQLQGEFPEDILLAEESSEQLASSPSLRAQVLDILTPHLGSLREEQLMESFRAREKNGEFTWVLDPIDGTKGFLRGDQFAVALAGMREEQLSFGLLGCPRLGASGPEPGKGAIGVAFRGRGSWQSPLDQNSWSAISVSSLQEPHTLRLLRSFEASHTNESQLENFVAQHGIQAAPVRLDSQAKYLLMARGDAEAVIRCLSPKRPNYREKIWDQAAGALIVLEAGGRICDLFGHPLDFSTGRELLRNVGVVASNGSLDTLDWSTLQAMVEA